MPDRSSLTSGSSSSSPAWCCSAPASRSWSGARWALDPWDVFHQGLSVATGLSIGVRTIVAGVVVLLLWIPLRQRPGIGTVANVVLVGLSLDGVLLLIPPTGDLTLRWIYLVAGIVLNGIATGATSERASARAPETG